MSTPDVRAPAENEHYYSVTTPEFETSPMSYDPPEPPEYGRDWALVVATSAREAVGLAVKAWVKGENPCVYDPGPLYWVGYRNYCQHQRADDLSPYTGVRAEIMVCGHGFEYRGPIGVLTDLHARGHDACPDCDREQQEDEAALASRVSASHPEED